MLVLCVKLGSGLE
jgi:hypothetical protein